MEKPNVKFKSIAVLPFANISGNEDLEYFSDGITEEIINALAKIKQLKVTSRTSSFFYKNKNIPITQIAKELKVASILEGSVRLSAKTIRITAQLIHAEEDFHYWSETWDRKLENIFEIQDEISLHIAEKLREQYGHFDIQEHLVEKKTTSIDAYEYSLKARYIFNKWNPVAAKDAIELFEKALELDPNHTDSYVGLADAYSFLAVTETMKPKEAWTKVRQYVDKAYSLNPENEGVHYLKANISFFQDADFQGAATHALKSVELKPSYPESQQFLAMLYMISGKIEKAEYHLNLAYEIDPLSQETLFYRAYFQYRFENYKDALELFNECLDKNPHNIPAYIVRSYCLLKMEQYDEAIEFLKKMPEEIVVPGERLGILCLANILKKDKKEADKYYNKLYEEAQKPTSFQAHSYLYLSYANLGKVDEAFDLIEKVMELNSSVLLISYTDPLANNLKSDSRFEIYRRKICNLPEPTEKNVQEKTAVYSQEEADILTKKLIEYVVEEEPFLVPNLSLRMLAERIEIHPNKLSWLLNEKIGKNFNVFVNHYRIEYFKKIALDPDNSHISLIGLAYESGFNSKTVFNTYFKKEMGITPKEFLKSKV